jgi:protein-L-isoaspartate O-methyltransferase
MNIRENDFSEMRRKMVIDQLSSRDIKDAYSDFPLPIENEQTISHPYAELANQVFSVERLKNLTEKAMAVKEKRWKKKSVDVYLSH